MMPTLALRFSIRSRICCFISGSGAAIECTNSAHDLVELTSFQFGIDRERNDLFGGTFGMRTRPLLIAEIREARLKVKRQRIVDRAADLLVREESSQVVPTLHPQGVLIEDRFVGAVHAGRYHVVELA